MGRRSVNATKAGKFMNPTDQARKEARRKELKKNKKQRQIVREAVIKQRDPKQIIDDLDLLDKMEFDTNNPPPYSAKVIQDKRRKLKEGLHKIYQFYQKDQAKLAYEVKQLESEYDSRHRVLVQQFDSIMQAQKVNIDDIPLPNYLPGAPSEFENIAQPNTELPADFSNNFLTNVTLPRSILKTATTVTDVDVVNLSRNFPNSPPGPPPSQPPNLSDFECDTDETELGIRADEPYRPSDFSKKIRFEGGEPTTEQEASNTYQPKPASSSNKQVSIQPPQPFVPPIAKKPNINPYQNYTAPSQPAAQSFNQPNSHYNRLQHLSNKPNPPTQTHHTSIQQSIGTSAGITSTTIEAKPVLRNKAAETTKFIPTSLLVRRDTNKKAESLQPQNNYAQSNKYNDGYQDRYASGPRSYNNQSMVNNNSNSSSQNISKSTDADYEKFMNEIGKLL